MKTFSIKEAVKHGWKLFRNHQAFLILATLIFFLLSGVYKTTNRHNEGFGSPIAWLVLFGVSILINIGWLKILLHIEDGKNASFKEFFTHIEVFWKYLGAYMLYMLVSILGLIFFIIPGIYFFITYGFATLLIVDKKDISIKEAFRESARMTKGFKWKLFGFLLIILLLNILGFVCFIVGALVSFPVTMLAHVHVYRKLSA